MPDNLGVLFLGDVVGRAGRRAMEKFMPVLIRKYNPGVVIANGENSAGGSGITEEIAKDLFLHVDVITSGNHIWDKKDALPYIEREPRILRPANYPAVNGGHFSYVYQHPDGFKVAVLSLQGRVFMEPIDCPFRRADEEITKLSAETPIILVDIHAEATSEKLAMGWYLDGRVSAVVGTHTHVQTADERVLPKGTGYITDLGMVGASNSVIGMEKEQALARFLTGRPQRFEPAKDGLMMGCLFVEVDKKTGRALSVKRELLMEA
jgi:hypothetical protein